MLSRTLLIALASIGIVLGATACAGDRRCERMLFESTPVGAELRAGFSHEVHHLARPTSTDDYEAGYVGGGALFGRGRTIHEGTWGRDYVGNRFARKVWLRWNDGYRGGGGAYKTDGPHLLGE